MGCKLSAVMLIVILL